MRKQTILAASAIAALVLASCNTNPKATAFTLTGEALPAELDSTYAYIYEPGSREAIDSVQIAGGTFTYTVDPADSTVYRLIKVGKKTVQFIPEAGAAKIVADEENNGYKLVALDSLGLNAKMLAYNAETDAALTPIQQEYRQKYTAYDEKEKAGFANDEERLALEAELDSIGASYSALNNEISTRTYEANAANALGAIAFSGLSFESDSDFVAKYDTASDIVKNNSQLKKRYDGIQTAWATSEGSKYVDFTIDNGQGQTAKLSDYLTDDRYLLVDFWASWCGPCRAAMPHLAGIVKDHAKTIRVLSIGVWEQSIEDNEKAKEELGMTWETAFDKESVGPETYGVQGIPTLMLIAPDGTIVYRGHSAEGVSAKIAELKL